jgi:hypothetical protein
MKPTATITTTILGCALAAGLASAQSPSIIQNTRATMNGVSNNATAASNQALGIAPQTASKPVHAAPASAVSAPARVTIAAKPSVKQDSKSSSAHGSETATKSSAGTKRVAAVGVKRDGHPKTVAAGGKKAAPVEASVSASENAAGDDKPAADGKYAANGRRDPFISPVVSHAGGSGCSTGKRCLEIGGINLRGVVHAESGFIAVVSNGMNKAYFLRENDPVFNGYVMKITGDSIVFQETLQDRLGKSFTREVVKKITTPAV